MLLKEYQHGLIEYMHITVIRLLRRFALIMDDGVRQIPVLPPTLQQTIREIDILTIHKEIFVEQPDSLQCLMAQQAERPAHHLNLARLVNPSIFRAATQGVGTARRDSGALEPSS